MSIHVGSVRSFDLGFPASAGRRWAARCSCGALATTDAWPDAMGFMTDHLRRQYRPRPVWSPARPLPDLRRADCWRPVFVANGHNGNGRNGNGGTSYDRNGNGHTAAVVSGNGHIAQNGAGDNGAGGSPRAMPFHRRVFRLFGNAARFALGLPLARG